MKFNTRLFPSRSKVNALGKCSIRCRITYDKQRKEFSTGLFINPKYWNRKKQKVLDDTDKFNVYINTQLSLIINKMNQAFLLLLVKETSFTVDDIYTLYKGEKLSREYNVVEYFELYLDRLNSLIGIEIKKTTWLKFFYVKKNLIAFIRWKYGKNDLPLNKLSLHFLTEFDYFLKVKKSQKQITINKTLQRFRKPVRVAVAEGYLEKDPFLLHKSKSVKNVIVFLNNDELKALEDYQFSQLRLQLVQDWFIFSCYTGLAYNEISRLSKKHIVLGFDGQMWIIMKREKTQKEIAIPILPKADMLLKKYMNDSNDTIFQLISNQRYNSYLKEVASVIGIEKRLTTHTARKTFASTILLYNDVPMDIVSEILGHSSITITEQSYGKIVRKKVGDAILNLNKKLKP